LYTPIQSYVPTLLMNDFLLKVHVLIFWEINKSKIVWKDIVQSCWIRHHYNKSFESF
jgi:hypothetical protein